MNQVLRGGKLLCATPNCPQRLKVQKGDLLPVYCEDCLKKQQQHQPEAR